MSISLRTRVALWGRSAARCAFPGCTRELVIDATETDDESLVGDIAHIVADSEDGPRGKSALTSEQRDKFDNLLLLCKIHHKQIDDQTNEFTVDRLLEMKRAHESSVRAALPSSDVSLQNDKEVYASYIDEWSKRARLDSWRAWTSQLLGGDQPRLDASVADELEELKTWIFGRVWPQRFGDLENALGNFAVVLSDLLLVIREHADEQNGILCTRRFYKIREWDPERYNELLKDYERHVGLVCDLVLELTRAANYVCDVVRVRLNRGFRMTDGVLLVEAGPFLPDLSYRQYRAEYRGAERSARPYPGLDPFLRLRRDRDYTFWNEADG